MENRSLGKVFLLTLVTLGLYGIYWEVKTKGEMNARGATIPTAWLILVPIVNIWWMWKYCEGVEHVTGGKLSTVISFLVLFLLGVIGMLILQDAFNKVGAAAVAAGPQMPSADAPVSPQMQSYQAPASPQAPTDTPVPPQPPTPVV